MKKGPQFTDLDDRLSKVFLQAQKQLYQEFLQAINAGDSGKVDQKLAQIKGLLAQMGNQYGKWSQIRTVEEYLRGSLLVEINPIIKELLDGMKYDDLALSKQSLDDGINALGTPHVDAVKELVKKSQAVFDSSLNSVYSQMSIRISDFRKSKILEGLAQGIAEGKSIYNQRKKILSELSEEGVVSFKDRAGNTWSLNRYSDMVARTETSVAYNRGTINRALETGITKLERDEAPDCCPICKPHDGEIWDMEKQGNPPDIYHPNCRGFRIPLPFID